MKLDWNWLKVQGQSCIVSDGIRESISTQISALIFRCTKCTESILINTINWSTGKSKEESIWKCCTHPFTEVTFLSSMCFINHNDYVISKIKNIFDITKSENSRYCNFTNILLKKVFNFFL